MATTSIAHMVNQALHLAGSKKLIGNIYEGSNEANAALDAWSETRDVLLIAQKPQWARRQSTMTLLKTAPAQSGYTADYTGTPWAPTSPPVPWLFEWAWPSDCVLPLEVLPQPTTIPVWRPRRTVMRMAFDINSVNRTILTNESVILMYIRSVTNPNLWTPDFQELMIEALAKKFSPDFSPQPAPQQEKRNERSDASN